MALVMPSFSDMNSMQPVPIRRAGKGLFPHGIGEGASKGAAADLGIGQRFIENVAWR